MSTLNKSALELVKESLKVGNNSVTFRTKTGRGSGCGVTIPTDQFAEFLKLMTDVQSKLDNPTTVEDNQ